jgi:nucleoside-diphosphate-sugar epimerase
VKTILVTDSKGLVGKKLCTQLRIQNIEVIELDLFGTASNMATTERAL